MLQKAIGWPAKNQEMAGLAASRPLDRRRRHEIRRARAPQPLRHHPVRPPAYGRGPGAGLAFEDHLSDRSLPRDLTPKPLAGVDRLFDPHILLRHPCLAARTFAGMGGTIVGELIIREKSAGAPRHRCFRAGWPDERAAPRRTGAGRSHQPRQPLIKASRRWRREIPRPAERVHGRGLKLVTRSIGWSIKTLVFAIGRGNAASKRAPHEPPRNRARSSGKVLVAITRRDNPQMVVGSFATAAAEGHPRSRWRRLGGLDRCVTRHSHRHPPSMRSAPKTSSWSATTDPFSVETVRATMGSIFAVPVTKAARRFLAGETAFQASLPARV
jgi:hypothetical protein